MIRNRVNRILETSSLEMVGNGEKERRHEVGDDRWRPHVNEGKPHQPEPLYKPL